MNPIRHEFEAPNRSLSMLVLIQFSTGCYCLSLMNVSIEIIEMMAKIPTLKIHFCPVRNVTT